MQQRGSCFKKDLNLGTYFSYIYINIKGKLGRRVTRITARNPNWEIQGGAVEVLLNYSARRPRCKRNIKDCALPLVRASIRIPDTL